MTLGEDGITEGAGLGCTLGENEGAELGFSLGTLEDGAELGVVVGALVGTAIRINGKRRNIITMQYIK